MLTTATTRAARLRASVAHDTATAGHLRDAVTGLSGSDRRHVLLVYDLEGNLICWCGPYTVAERLTEATRWGAAGWRWTVSPRPTDNPGPLLRLGDMTVMIA